MALFDFLRPKRKEQGVSPGTAKAEAELDASKIFGVPTLRDLVTRRLERGEDLGFSDIQDRVLNPQISALKRKFTEETSPFLSEQASSRGLGRSDVALTQQRTAERDLQDRVGDLVSTFTALNEQQRKADVGQAVDVAKYLGGQEQQIRGARANLALGEQERSDTQYEALRSRKNATDAQIVQTLIGSAFGGATPDASTPSAAIAASTASPNLKLAGNLNPLQLNALNVEELLALLGQGGL